MRTMSPPRKRTIGIASRVSVVYTSSPTAPVSISIGARVSGSMSSVHTCPAPQKCMPCW